MRVFISENLIHFLNKRLSKRVDSLIGEDQLDFRRGNRVDSIVLLYVHYSKKFFFIGLFGLSNFGL